MEQLEADFHVHFYDYFNQLDLIKDNGAYMEAYYLPEQAGEGSLRRLIIKPGLELILSDYCFWSDITTTFKGDEPMIELNYCLEGHGIIDASGHSADIRQNDCQLWLLKDVEASMVHLANRRASFVGLRMKVDVFDNYMQACYPDGRSGFSYILGSGHLRIYQQTISPGIQAIIQQIMHCPRHEPFKRIYMESKALELLWLSLESCLQEPIDRHKSSILRGGDLEKIRAAKRILEERLEHPPTLLELSRLIGLNDYKLKAGFKEVFDTTVFGALRELRLERAKQYLEAGRMNVSEVALSVGYSNPGYFSEAFCKKYGVKPKLLLNR